MSKTSEAFTASPLQKTEALYLADHGMTPTRIQAALGLRCKSPATSVSNWRAARRDGKLVPLDLGVAQRETLDGLLMAEGLVTQPEPEPPTSVPAVPEPPQVNGHQLKMAEPDKPEITLTLSQVQNAKIAELQTSEEILEKQLLSAREALGALKTRVEMEHDSYAKLLADKDDEIDALKEAHAAEVERLKRQLESAEQLLAVRMEREYLR